jgi:hypothetical protein
MSEILSIQLGLLPSLQPTSLPSSYLLSTTCNYKREIKQSKTRMRAKRKKGATSKTAVVYRTRYLMRSSREIKNVAIR